MPGWGRSATLKSEPALLEQRALRAVHRQHGVEMTRCEKSPCRCDVGGEKHLLPYPLAPPSTDGVPGMNGQRCKGIRLQSWGTVCMLNLLFDSAARRRSHRLPSHAWVAAGEEVVRTGSGRYGITTGALEAPLSMA
jgi:hypothetical protein